MIAQQCCRVTMHSATPIVAVRLFQMRALRDASFRAAISFVDARSAKGWCCLLCLHVCVDVMCSAFGVVYAGRWRHIDVAIKEVKFDSEEQLNDFKLEAQKMQGECGVSYSSSSASHIWSSQICGRTLTLCCFTACESNRVSPSSHNCVRRALSIDVCLMRRNAASL